MKNDSTSLRTVLQSCLSSSWGGLEMVAFENSMALNRRGVECYTLCLQNSPLEKRLKEQNLPTYPLKKRPGFLDFIKIRQFLKNHHVGTLLVQHLKDMKFLAMALIQIPEVKVVAISHTFVNVSKKDFLHRWSYKRIKKMICLTDLQKKNLLQHLPLSENHMAILPNYVDCAHFHPRKDRDTAPVRNSFRAPEGVPLIGVASRLDPQKGQDVALRALKILKDKGLRVHLAIVGENTLNEMDYLSTLKELAKQLGVENWVHFAGFREDMECVMAALDVLLMPSQCETFGRVAIEAMASKTPVIATRSGGVPNIISHGHDGLLVTPNSPEEMAAEIERLLRDRALYVRLQEKALENVQKKYSKDVVEEKLVHLLQTA